MASFEVSTHIAASPERVFEVSLDVDVHTNSLTGSDERAIGGVTAGGLRLGDTVTWQARHFGIRWRMTSVISACDYPGYFVDEQVAGPFRRWHHRHYFGPDEASGTVMRDAIDFSAPLGPLGTLTEFVVLNRYMRQLILLRNKYIKTIAEQQV
ncbi:SRPBCC family protein [Amycolatopsis sp. lyj-108]|uniref:SRPBCC family protein n=1 Tax=Amycolatopsis sp. lyj-108 TaxID=2789286 RepID=UPI00397C1C50